MLMLKLLVIFCMIFALHWQCVESRGGGKSGGRSRSSSSHSYKSSKSSHNSGSGSGGGWFSWFRGGSKTSAASASATAATTSGGGTRRGSPPNLSHKETFAQSPSHIGFAAYGNNYEANFHNSRSNQFRPVSHPYQRHFQPQQPDITTAVFAYHFMPSTHVHHIHHYSSSSSSSSSRSQEPVFYDYRNSSASSTPSAKQPIIYDYTPIIPKNDSLSSESDEDEFEFSATNPNDVFVAGVENMLFYGSMKDNQHLVVFVQQGSDGISFEDELLSSLYDFESSERPNLQYFPDVEFRFDADDEPNDDDLDNIYRMYKDLVDNGQC